MNQTATYPIEVVLSVRTDLLLTDFDNLWSFLRYMTRDDNLFTHQLPRAQRRCRAAIFFQHPTLEGIDASGVNPDNWQEFVAEMKAKFGDVLPIAPITDWELKDPVAELAEMVGDASKVKVLMPGVSEADIQDLIDDLTS